MFGYIGKSLLAVCGSLVLITTCYSDMFTQSTNIHNTQPKQSYTLKEEAQTMLNKQSQNSQTVANNLKELVSSTNLKPKDIPNPHNLSINKQNNAVWFYFTNKNFNVEKVQEAINLARSYNLYPVIYYLSNQCSFENAQQINNFFYQHGLQYIFTNNYSDVDFELSCNHSLLSQLDDENDVYFKFMSINGLHGSGYLNDFKKVYSSCFIR